jgi:exosome complex RNA-binding protein Csl4
MADNALKPGDLVPGRVIRVQTMLAQVVAREQRGVIYGGAAGQLTVDQLVKVRILEVNGSNGYSFTARLLA